MFHSKKLFYLSYLDLAFAASKDQGNKTENTFSPTLPEKSYEQKTLSKAEQSWALEGCSLVRKLRTERVFNLVLTTFFLLCKECDCNPKGSMNQQCDLVTGQCFCQPGVTGKACDKCMPLHYEFSDEGCKNCDCYPEGSTDLQCDLVTGQCPCKDEVEERRCYKGRNSQCTESFEQA